MTQTIRAAGGAVWRRSGHDALEVLIVHRPKYDDWTLPKGKAEAGEADEETALREVAEETGVEGLLGPELTRVDYLDRNRRPKTVRYWSMTVKADLGHPPDDEVDEVVWVPLDAAEARLTYGRDRVVLDALREILGD